jgi:signal peptidase II
MRLITIWAVLAFGIDQLSKLVVVHLLDLKTRLALDVLPPLLNFRMGWNRGVNFGLFAQDSDALRWALIALAVGISAWLIHWARRLPRPLAQVSAGLIVGGALANALDRMIYGAVADFLNMSCCGIQNPFTFNIADIFIFAGAFGLIFFADEGKKPA